VTTAQLQFPSPSRSHRMRVLNGTYGAVACRDCGLGAGYTATTRPCRRRRQYPCGQGGYWQPDFGRDECQQTFDSQAEATRHWFDEHHSKGDRR
jgi:hypothetical protein